MAELRCPVLGHRLPEFSSEFALRQALSRGVPLSSLAQGAAVGFTLICELLIVAWVLDLIQITCWNEDYQGGHWPAQAHMCAMNHKRRRCRQQREELAGHF